MRTCRAALLIGVLASVVLAAFEDPFTGTWTLNLPKSSLPPPGPRSVVSHFECTAQWVSIREELVDAEGRRQTVSIKAGFDGKDYPLIGSQVADTVSYTRMDSRTITGTSKKRGKVLVNEKAVLSEDGRTMTVTYSGVDAEGQPVTGMAVFEKQQR